MTARFAIATVMLVSLAFAVAREAGAETAGVTVRVAGAVDRSMVASSGNASAYLTIANDGGVDERLLSVTCKWCGAVEIHAMRKAGGKATMQRLSYGVKIPPGQTMSFSPATVHVMLVRPRVVLVAGGQVRVTLHFLHAGDVDVMLPVTNICKAPAPLPARRSF